MDQLSLKRLETLHPDLVEIAKKTFEKAEKVLTGRAKPRITYALRTFKEQNDLYNLGRTVVNPDGKTAKKPKGNIVTNAKAGQSIHNYGLAVDFALIIDGKTASWDNLKDWDGDMVSDWTEVVRIFKGDGWEWGGDWKTFKDLPHFQYDFGYSWQQLQAKYNAGETKNGYVKLNKDVLATNQYRTTSSVNLRKEAVTGAVIVVVLKGELVTEISRSNGWSKVTYNGVTGYMSNQYLTK